MAAPMKYFQFQLVKATNSDDETPSCRSGHRIVVDNKGNMYSIGGYNPLYWNQENDPYTIYPLFRELWKFNLTTKQWTQLDTYIIPTELASHSAMLHGHNLLTFGGTGVPFGDGASNQLYSCSLKNMEWQHIKCTGPHPIRVYGHTMNVIGDDLYICGGTTGWEYNIEIHKLNFRTLEWEEVEPKNTPPAGRYRHEVVLYNGKLFVFGGGTAMSACSFTHVDAFDFESSRWESIPATKDAEHGYPGKRRCHSVAHVDHYAYICGGYDGVNIYNDFWRFNLITCTWFKLPATMPEPVYFHSVAVTKEGCMVIFGGVIQLDVKRTNNVYIVWLKVPSLKEICWQTLLKLSPNVVRHRSMNLLENGIPPDLVARIG